jgi:hypothetical protein
MLLELLERRYDQASTVFCTRYAQKDWHQRLGSGVYADAIMDRIVHNTIWVETGGHSMRDTPPARSRHRHARGRESLATDRAIAWLPKAISVAPEGNIYWPPNPHILTGLLPCGSEAVGVERSVPFRGC